MITLKKRVSEKTIRRLSHYARCLRYSGTQGRNIITSRDLADTCKISSAAVRKDLASYGEFGKQGSGYDVNRLLENIEKILGTDNPPPVIVIGAGNIGRALIKSGLEGSGGYSYSAVFDCDSSKTGLMCAGLKIRSMTELKEIIDELGEVIAIITVPSGVGQEAVDLLVKAGCNALLSFTLEPLDVPEGVNLRFIEVFTELDILTHSMRKKSRKRK